MPSFADMKKRYAHYGTVGQQIKEISDYAMEETWWNDPQSKRCYIYDYFHDDQPELASNMTYENTTKTPIDAKFIVSEYGSISKDQVSYHLMFRPSQKDTFLEGDSLYYYQTDVANRYGVKFPIGMWIDIPNDKGVYEKWLICWREKGNQFIKYFILPCDYFLQWIEDTGTSRIKRQMWCVSRAMNNYTSGRWTDNYFTTPDDIQKVWLPINPITEKIRYKNGRKDNQRILMDVFCEEPLAWQVSKVERTKPLGIIRITLDQDVFNRETDYVNLETHEMYADYYSQSIVPEKDNTSTTPDISYKILCSTNQIKNNGSYRTLSVHAYDKSNTDMTDTLEDFSPVWSCEIDGVDFTSNDYVVWKEQLKINEIKIKLGNNSSYLTKLLNIKCKVQNNECNFLMEITS